ncbi:universal stress protein [Kitasatospora sp. NPDC048538]|uniref:universal stress protein n=1 Tax=unclassified Kitasatospora TaxID=2633591 RepID=UPI0033DD618E
MNGTTARRRIVVGSDGSESSRAALRWALRQAALVGAAVEAVTAWEYPASHGLVPATVDGDAEALAGKVLAETVAREWGLDRLVEVRERVAPGNAARVLLTVAEGAELLVVGNRGHGGFTGAVLGSVTQHCVQHASCPVVVVREAGRAKAEPGDGR